MLVFPKLKDFIVAHDILMGLMNKELPGKIAVKVERFIDSTNELYDNFKRVEHDIYDKYAEKDDNGNIKYLLNENKMVSVMIKPDLKEEFNKIMEGLLNEQLKYAFDTDNYFTYDEISEIQHIKPLDINLLKWMIIDVGGGSE